MSGRKRKFPPNFQVPSWTSSEDESNVGDPGHDRGEHGAAVGEPHARSNPNPRISDGLSPNVENNHNVAEDHHMEVVDDGNVDPVVVIELVRDARPHPDEVAEIDNSNSGSGSVTNDDLV